MDRTLWHSISSRSQKIGLQKYVDEQQSLSDVCCIVLLGIAHKESDGERSVLDMSGRVLCRVVYCVSYKVSYQESHIQRCRTEKSCREAAPNDLHARTECGEGHKSNQSGGLLL